MIDCKYGASWIVLLALVLPTAASATDPDRWAPVRFLVGSWQGEGNAGGAEGMGTTVFAWEVANQLLVRRDRTDYAATAGQPAYTYEALMVIYQDPASKRIEATYFDSGNHVLHYRLAADSPPDSVRFVSDGSGGPVFRLSYRLSGPSDLTVTFEIQPPGAPAFQTIASGVVHKQP